MGLFDGGFADILKIGVAYDTDELDAGGRQIESKSDALAQKVAGIFAIGSVVAFSTKAVQAFGEQEQAVAKVQSALDTMGTFGSDAIGRMEQKAKDLQATSLFGDEEILENVTAQLLTFGNVGEESFDRAQQASVDLAAHLGGDLKSATIQIGKALNDPIKGVTALSDVGVSFTEDQRDMISAMTDAGDVAGAQAIILGELEKQYGGTAQAISEVGTGPLVQLKNSFQDIIEVVGGVIAEALVPVVEVLQRAVTWFSGLDESTQRIVTSIGLVTAALVTLRTVGMGPIGLAISAIVAAGTMLYSNWDTITAFLTESWLAFKVRFLSASLSVIESLEDFINGSMDLVRPLLSALGIDLPDQVTIGSNAIRSALASAGTELGLFRAEQTRTADEAARMKAEAEKAASAVDGIGASSGTAAPSVRDLGTAASDAATEVESAVPRIVGELERVKTEGVEPIATSIMDPGEDGVIGAIRMLPAEVAAAGDAASGEVESSGAWGTMLGRFNNAWRDAADQISGLFNGEGGLWGAITGGAGFSGLLSKVTGEGGLKGAFSSVVGSITGGGGIGGAISGLFGGSGSPLGGIVSAISGGGGLMSAVTGVAGLIPGWGQAFTGVVGVLDTLGINLDGIIGKIGNVLGLGNNDPLAAQSAARNGFLQALNQMVDDGMTRIEAFTQLWSDMKDELAGLGLKRDDLALMAGIDPDQLGKTIEDVVAEYIGGQDAALSAGSKYGNIESYLNAAGSNFVSKNITGPFGVSLEDFLAMIASALGFDPSAAGSDYGFGGTGEEGVIKDGGFSSLAGAMQSLQLGSMVEQAAAAIATITSPPVIAVPVMAGAGKGTEQTIVIPVNIDGRPVAETVVRHIPGILGGR